MTYTKKGFQYILCWSSSLRYRLGAFCTAVFQYILCWSSSQKEMLWNGHRNSFNTSYVEVHHKCFFVCCLLEVVSIHLMLKFIGRDGCNRSLYWGVSIHLMLKFIWEVGTPKLDVIKFQYILCWSSSSCVQAPDAM